MVDRHELTRIPDASPPHLFMRRNSFDDSKSEHRIARRHGKNGETIIAAQHWKRFCRSLSTLNGGNRRGIHWLICSRPVLKVESSWPKPTMTIRRWSIRFRTIGRTCGSLFEPKSINRSEVKKERRLNWGIVHTANRPPFLQRALIFDYPGVGVECSPRLLARREI